MKVQLIRKSDKKVLSTTTVEETMGMLVVKFVFPKGMLEGIKKGDSLFVSRVKEDTK